MRTHEMYEASGRVGPTARMGRRTDRLTNSKFAARDSGIRTEIIMRLSSISYNSNFTQVIISRLTSNQPWD
jgi:hypothetical protein